MKLSIKPSRVLIWEEYLEEANTVLTRLPFFPSLLS